MKTVLLTGATGFVGRFFCRKFCTKFNIVAVSRNDQIGIEGVEVIKADLNEPGLKKHLPSKVDYVVHLAQSREYRDFPISGLDIFRVNVASTAELLDYALNADVQSVIVASSGNALNYCLENTWNKNCKKPSAIDYYLRAKGCAEILSQAYSELLNIVIIRPFFVYGPEQASEMLIPRLIKRISEGDSIYLDGEKGAMINPIFVIDMVEALASALEVDRSVALDVAGPELLTIKDLTQIIGKHLNKKVNYEPTHNEPVDIIGNTALMQQLLGTSKTRFEEVIDGLVNVDLAD